ncbi:MAG: DUF4199 family protein [Bacteroidetes bacterium]|nr:DUF4199 family protein [Bacteroidota bacterium]
MKKIYLAFGIFSGLISSVYLYFFYKNNLFITSENNFLFRSFSFIILCISVIFAIIGTKKVAGNQITFMRSMFTGFMVSLINGIVNFIGFSLIYILSPHIFSKAEKVAQDIFVKNVQNSNDTSVNIPKALENIHLQFTPGGFLLPNMFTSFVIGMITAVFVTAFVYNRRN